MYKSTLINGENPPNMDNPQQAETVWAYMAGIIDGEGCISASKYPNARTYKVELIIVQKNDTIPLWLIKNICNSRQIDQVKRGIKKVKYWRWSISGKDALYVLSRCLPYLVEKKAQAELAIELLKNRTPRDKRSRKGKAGSIGELEHIVARQAEIADMLKWLKRNRAAAETERVESERISDSPNCKDGKLAEVVQK